MKLTTKNNYDFYEVASALQKSIRRGDVKTAGYFALELYHSGYYKYVWKRLLTVSAEDCHGIITQEIYCLFQSFMMANSGKKDFEKGRIFISKAVIVLCECKKNRDADHLQNYVYDKKMIDENKIEEILLEPIERLEIPDYTFDVHTLKGKRRGKTKNDFFVEELEALVNRQKGLFDDVVC